jgi:hypothetical protein
VAAARAQTDLPRPRARVTQLALEPRRRRAVLASRAEARAMSPEVPVAPIAAAVNRSTFGAFAARWSIPLRGRALQAAVEISTTTANVRAGTRVRERVGSKAAEARARRLRAVPLPPTH